VETRTLKVEWLPAPSNALLSSAKASEVFGSLGGSIVVEFHHNPTGGYLADLDIKEDAGVHHFAAQNKMFR
jgi:hypothetical protein